MDGTLELELELVDLGDAKTVTMGDLSFVGAEEDLLRPYKIND